MTKILLLGEAFGAKENLFNHGFVGNSGAELGRMLIAAGTVPNILTNYPGELDMIKFWQTLREEYDIEIANVFNAQPEGNKIEKFFTSAKEGNSKLPPLAPGKYVRWDMMHHIEALHAKLEALEPTLVIALGNAACWATLGETKITNIRGTVKISPRFGFKVLPTFHPAYVLRQWNTRTIVLSDLQKANKEALTKNINRIKRWVTVQPSLSDIMEWILRPAEFYAVDIETSLKQISMIGFARSSADAIVIPFIDDMNPGYNYWPTVNEEIHAWKLVDKLLKKPVPKIFQNGIFDLTYILMSNLRPVMCNHDTMLLHHSLYPEMLKGLGFLGSIYSEEIAWKGMRTKGNNLKRDE